MDGEAGWWATSGNIGLPPLARVMGVGRQQHVGDSEMYLGNQLFNNIYKTKIDTFVCDFERRSMHIIHNFSICDIFTLKHIFSTYCESLYGCELSNFTKTYVKIVYVMA